MTALRNSLPPDVYLRHMFASKAALDGGVVRRSVKDIERVMGREAFCAEMRRRGFTTVENAGQMVVFCNSEPVQRWT